MSGIPNHESQGHDSALALGAGSAPVPTVTISHDSRLMTVELPWSYSQLCMNFEEAYALHQAIGGQLSQMAQPGPITEVRHGGSAPLSGPTG